MRDIGILFCLLLAAGCDPDTTAVVSPGIGDNPQTPVIQSPASITLSHTPSVVIAGLVPHVYATVRAAGGAIVAEPSVSWSSSDQSVALAVNSCNPAAKTCAQASIIALGDGRSTITATARGVSVSFPVTVVMKATAAVEVRIASFEVAEVQYPSTSGWYYAPLVRVTEPTGMRSVDVVGMEIRIPGLGDTRFCGGTARVAAGQSLDLFRATSYGDFDVVIYAWGGTRASGAPPVVTLFVRDDSGAVGTVTAAGAVVPGKFPAPDLNEVTTAERGDVC